MVGYEAIAPAFCTLFAQYRLENQGILPSYPKSVPANLLPSHHLHRVDTGGSNSVFFQCFFNFIAKRIISKLRYHLRFTTKSGKCTADIRRAPPTFGQNPKTSFIGLPLSCGIKSISASPIAYSFSPSDLPSSFHHFLTMFNGKCFLHKVCL